MCLDIILEENTSTPHHLYFVLKPSFCTFLSFFCHIINSTHVDVDVLRNRLRNYFLNGIIIVLNIIKGNCFCSFIPRKKTLLFTTIGLNYCIQFNPKIIRPIRTIMNRYNDYNLYSYYLQSQADVIDRCFHSFVVDIMRYIINSFDFYF